MVGRRWAGLPTTVSDGRPAARDGAARPAVPDAWGRAVNGVPAGLGGEGRGHRIRAPGARVRRTGRTHTPDGRRSAARTERTHRAGAGPTYGPSAPTCGHESVVRTERTHPRTRIRRTGRTCTPGGRGPSCAPLQAVRTRPGMRGPEGTTRPGDDRDAADRGTEAHAASRRTGHARRCARRPAGDGRGVCEGPYDAGPVRTGLTYRSRRHRTAGTASAADARPRSRAARPGPRGADVRTAQAVPPAPGTGNAPVARRVISP